MSYLTKDEYRILKHEKLQDLGRSDCPFCAIEIQRERMLWSGKFFYVVEALAPYIKSNKHLLTIPYGHKKYTYELTKAEFSELQEVELFMKGFYDEEEYFSFIRETMGKRSIEHLHYHFLPGVIRGSKIGEMLELQGYTKN